MSNKQNLNFESTRIKVPESSKEDTQVDSVESVRVDLENSLAIDDQDEPASPARSLPLRDKFSGLNTKLSSYLERIKKSERRLAESVQKVKRLEEANRVLKEDSREQLEFLRLQLDEQIRKTVLAENQRAEAEERLETCTKHSSQIRSELETQKARAGELEESLNVERRRSKEALGELVSLREQMLQERTEYNEQKQQMMNLKIDYAKLQERFKINTAELTFSQSRLGELQNQTHFTADEVQKKLSDLKQRLEKKFSDTMTEKLREKRNEIKRLQDELQNKLQSVLQTSIAVEDFELLKTQLEEQQRRAEAAATEAADWRQKFHESESELKRAGNEYAKQLEEERRRRKELNKRLLAQSKAQDEVRQELENYRKLIEGLDQGGSYSAECLSFVTTPEGVAGSPLFLGSPLGRLQLPGGTPNLPEARTRLLRKAVTPKKTSSTAESESLIQVMNDGRHQPQET